MKRTLTMLAIIVLCLTILPFSVAADTDDGAESSPLETISSEQENEQESQQEGEQEYIKEIRFFQDFKRISSAKSEAESKGYTVLDHDLLKGIKYQYSLACLLAYKTTTNPDEAVRDLKIFSYDRQAYTGLNNAEHKPTRTYNGCEYTNVTVQYTPDVLGYYFTSHPTTRSDNKLMTPRYKYIIPYVSYDKNAGEPILADIICTTSLDDVPEGYVTSTDFDGNPANYASDLSKLDSGYISFKVATTSEESQLVASAFAPPTIWVVIGIGAVVVAVAALLIVRSRKNRKTTQE